MSGGRSMSSPATSRRRLLAAAAIKATTARNRVRKTSLTAPDSRAPAIAPALPAVSVVTPSRWWTVRSASCIGPAASDPEATERRPSGDARAAGIPVSTRTGPRMVARPVLPVEIDSQGTVPFVTEGGVVTEGAGVRVDVEHVATVVAVVARPGDEVVAEHHARRCPARGVVEVVEGTPVRATGGVVVDGDHPGQRGAVGLVAVALTDLPAAVDA